MIQNFRTGLAFICTVLLLGCVAPGAKWFEIDSGKSTAEIGRFSIDMPTGWMRLGDENANRILLSRDGANLQMIEVICAKGDSAFPKLKRNAPAGALASELAELQLAEMHASPGMDNLKVVKNEPAVIVMKNGYMLHILFKNGRGLRYERIVYGFVDADLYCTVTYQAPTLHYFVRDRRLFDTVLRSLRESNKVKSS